MSSHFARATGSEMRASRKSAGTLCTAPGEIAFLVMDFILHRYAISLGSPAAVLGVSACGSDWFKWKACSFACPVLGRTLPITALTRPWYIIDQEQRSDPS
jgi:hypothetical protein